LKEIKLNKKGYQNPYADIKITKVLSNILTAPDTITPGEELIIRGTGFTGFQRRGNPGVAVLIDGRPLTGCKLKSNGKFKLKMKMPPFSPGEHTIEVFGVKKTIIVAETDDIVTQQELSEIAKRDFKLTKDAHILYSDVKYRVTPIEVLECYLGRTI